MPTTIKLKNSVTTTSTPTSLAQGEVAINVTDKKVWVGNAATTPVQILGAGTTGTAAGSNTQVQYNSSGTLAGDADFTFNGTTVTMTNDASISGLTVGKGAGSIAFNTVVGLGALAANTTGSFNSAFGNEALKTVTTGGQNNAFGYQALNLTTTGTSNNAFGVEALEANTTGSNNSAFGDGALRLNTTASNNTAVGYQAGYSNTTGTLNASLGYQAGYGNTTGSYNVFLGAAAGNSNTTSANNTMVGGYAGALTTGANNTFMGQSAGYYVTTGATNTFIGVSSGVNVTTGSKNTILGSYNGNQGGLDIRTTSNNIVISDGDGNPRIVVTPAGDVCIGRTASQGKLGVERSNADWCYNSNQTGSGTKNHFRFTDDSTVVGTITSSGSTTSYNTSSDYRLKENIEPMTGALAKVISLKPVTYKWKIDGSDGQGFIAHELQEIFPEAVTGTKDALDKDGNILPQGIDTSHLVATLVSAIQELKLEFEAYKASHP